MSMQRRHLREVVEIVGVLSIVASLLLVAWEVRQSNRIAGTEVVLRLADQFNEIHSDRTTSLELAKVYPKLTSPQSHLITATENSQMEGLAWRYVNIYIAAQVAFDNGVLSREHFERYIAGATSMVEAYPGLHPHLIRIATTLPKMRSMEVMQPLVKLAAEKSTESAEDQ